MHPNNLKRIRRCSEAQKGNHDGFDSFGDLAVMVMT